MADAVSLGKGLETGPSSTLAGTSTETGQKGEGFDSDTARARFLPP